MSSHERIPIETAGDGAHVWPSPGWVEDFLRKCNELKHAANEAFAQERAARQLLVDTLSERVRADA